METGQIVPETVSHEQLAGELRALMLTAEDLLEHAAQQAGESGVLARAKLAAAMESIKTKIAAIDNQAMRIARQAAHGADRYVHQHPWQSAAFSAVAAGSVGFLLGLLVGRR